MIVSQYRRVFLRLCVLCILAAGLWYFSDRTPTRYAAQDYSQAVQYLPIAVKQLPQINGIPAVELKCENAELPAPNKIESFPCEVINNTSKRISALSVAYSIAAEKEGKVTAHDEMLTFETYLHPDLREERKDNLIPPGGERPIRPLPISIDDATVKAISMQVDYVEFEGNTSSGPNKAGSRVIAGIREGAAKYRNWLLGRYVSGGKSINEMTSLIRDDSIGEGEPGIENENQRQGAIMYRNYLVRLYEKSGAESLAQFLERTSRTK